MPYGGVPDRDHHPPRGIDEAEFSGRLHDRKPFQERLCFLVDGRDCEFPGRVQVAPLSAAFRGRAVKGESPGLDRLEFQWHHDLARGIDVPPLPALHGLCFPRDEFPKLLESPHGDHGLAPAIDQAHRPPRLLALRIDGTEYARQTVARAINVMFVFRRDQFLAGSIDTSRRLGIEVHLCKGIGIRPSLGRNHVDLGVAGFQYDLPARVEQAHLCPHANTEKPMPEVAIAGQFIPGIAAKQELSGLVHDRKAAVFSHPLRPRRLENERHIVCAHRSSEARTENRNRPQGQAKPRELHQSHPLNFRSLQAFASACAAAIWFSVISLARVWLAFAPFSPPASAARVNHMKARDLSLATPLPV